VIGSGFPSHIGDRNGGGLLLQSRLAVRGGCNMTMHYDIYCIRSGSIADHISQPKESGCKLKICDPPISRYVMKTHSFIIKLMVSRYFIKGS